MSKIVFDNHTNLLKENYYEYEVQDVAEPNLFPEMFQYDQIPKIAFNQRTVPMRMPEDIWITDTTFRDGQQGYTPYSPEQIRDLYKLLHRLGGPKGVVRQCEFFLYSESDRRAIELCRELGYDFPEITGWIRATKQDFKLANDMKMRECGILVSCSDYHIFRKLKLTRA